MRVTFCRTCSHADILSAVPVQAVSVVPLRLMNQPHTALNMELYPPPPPPPPPTCLARSRMLKHFNEYQMRRIDRLYTLYNITHTHTHTHIVSSLVRHLLCLSKAPSCFILLPCPFPDNAIHNHTNTLPFNCPIYIISASPCIASLEFALRLSCFEEKLGGI